MAEKKTHREVKTPKISARYLADYMAASEQSKRTIVRKCKYPKIARLIQHNEAKAEIGKFLRTEGSDIGRLQEKAQKIRNRLAGSDFEIKQDKYNADFILSFVNNHNKFDFPTAEKISPGRLPPIVLGGTRVTLETQLKLKRVTRTQKIYSGGIMLRYAKGKSLPEEIGSYQSAFLFGYLRTLVLDDGYEPEHKLCLTVDASGGNVFKAPTDSIRRFKNMEAACASIAERWPAIAPPRGAII